MSKVAADIDDDDTYFPVEGESLASTSTSTLYLLKVLDPCPWLPREVFTATSLVLFGGIRSLESNITSPTSKKITSKHTSLLDDEIVFYSNTSLLSGTQLLQSWLQHRIHNYKQYYYYRYVVIAKQHKSSIFLLTIYRRGWGCPF